MAERKLTIRMNADTKNLQAGMATASASTQSFGKSIQSGITRHAAGIRMTGLAIAGLGAAMTAMSVLSVKAAMSFEKELANVSTMLDDIGMELMPAYAEGLRKMSKQFGESTETLSKGLYDILSASIAPTKALDVLAVSAKLAAAGLTDTGVAADAVTTIINSYGMAAEDAGKISDWMFAVVKRGKTTIAELAPSVGKVAATASIAGLSLEELGSSIATITRNGIRSEEAMTAINGILRAFLKPTDDAAKAAKDFGFELNTNTLRTKGVIGVLKLLENATAEQTAAMFPNIRGLKGIAAQLKDVTGVTEDYELMLNSTGLTQEAFDKQTSTLAFTFAQLKQEFADIFREIGTALIPIIKSEFVPLIRKVIDHIKIWVERFKALSPEMRKFLMVLGPILIALGGLIALLPTLAPIIAILLGPIGLIVAAIAGLTAAFIYFWTTSGKFRATIKNIGEVFRVVFLNIWNYTKWFKDNWAALWATILMGAFNIIKNFGYNAWEVIKGLGERIAGWGSWFGKNFLNVWKNLFSAIGTSVKNFGANIWEYMKWIGEKMKPQNWFKKIEKPEWKPLLEGFEAVWEELPKFAEVQLKSLVENVKNYMEPLPELVKPVWAAVEDGAKGAGDVVDELGNKIDELAKRFERFRDVVTGTGKKLTKSFDDFEDVAISATASVMDALIMFLKKIDGVSDAVETIPMAIQKAEDIITPAFDNFSILIRDWIVELLSVPKAIKPIPKAIAKAAEVIIPAGIDISAVIRDWYLALLGIPKAIKPIPTAIKKARDIIIPAGINISKVIMDWYLALFRVPEAIKPIPKAIQKAEDIITPIATDFSILIRDWIVELISVPKAIESIPRAIQRAEDVFVSSGINISAIIKDWYLALFRVPEVIKPISKAIQKAEDVIIAAGTNFSVIIRDWWVALNTIPEVIKPIPQGIQKAKDVIIPAALDISAAIRDWYVALFRVPEAVKEIPRAIEKARDVIVPAGVDIEEVIDGIKYAASDAGAMIKRMGEAAKEYFSKMENWLGNVLNALADVISGTKTFGQALLNLAYSIPVIGGIAKAFVNLAVAIWDLITGVAAAKQAMEDMLEDIAEQTEELSQAFKDVGASLTGSIEDAERAIRNLTQAQEDLALNTREKLIKELDNYYDYRVLKEMDLTQLLALSAETREKLEKGTLEEIAETAEEAAEREKDAKVSTLQAIEDAYAKESELINKKIKLLEIEIKLLMASAAAEQGNLEEAERLRKEANKELKDLLYTEEEQLELRKKAREQLITLRHEIGRYGVEGKKAINDISIATEQWGSEIGRIPRRIDFDVIGNLHMPHIPRIGDQSFTIWGQYRAPNIPSYQVGTPYVPETGLYELHKGERVTPAYQNREGQRGGGDVIVNIPRGAVVVYGDIRTKMDEEEFIERAGTQIGEQVGKQILRTVPL